MTRPLRVGHIKLSFHDAASEQVELLLRSHGHAIERLSNRSNTETLLCRRIDETAAWHAEHESQRQRELHVRIRCATGTLVDR